MLIIVSDLGLSDGTQCDLLPARYLEFLIQRLRHQAMAASYRSDGRFRPVERIDLVLLGDTFDCIGSVQWLNSEARPWSDPHSTEFISSVSRVLGGILEKNQRSIRLLRSLTRDAAIRVPPGARRGTIDHDAREIPVAVQLFYLVGDRDWFFRLPGPQYDHLRAAVVEHLGLANRSDRPFPHDPAESEPILETMRRHKVLARHGDIYDPFYFEEDRNKSSLNDAFEVELVSRFCLEIEREVAAKLPQAVMAALRDRPKAGIVMSRWIAETLDHTGVLPELQEEIKAIWDHCCDHFLTSDFVRRHDACSPIDLVDSLGRMLKFGKRLSTHWTTHESPLAFPPGNDSYRRCALAEHDLRSGRAQHIVYGHAHIAARAPSDAISANLNGQKRMLFNTGGWRRPCRYPHPQAGLPSVDTETIPYVTFFEGDECEGRPFESWCETLGLDHRADVFGRIDAAHGSIGTPKLLVDEAGYLRNH